MANESGSFVNKRFFLMLLAATLAAIFAAFVEHAKAQAIPFSHKSSLSQAAQAPPKPCVSDPIFRQFDFWIGEWDVKPAQAPEGPSAGSNSITRAADGCIIMESWTGARGGNGKSLNFYNLSTGKWQQTWVGSDATVLEYHGEYKDGAMRFEGDTVGKNGAKIRNKLTFFNISPDRVRQLAEASSDEGKTWKTSYDLMYFRKK